MAVGEHEHDITRRYLLGQLTDDEEQKLEERLLCENDFFQELELTKDELAQEYVSGQLTAEERQWLQENFLASPEGKQSQEFAKTFDRYVTNQRAQRQKSPSLIGWLRQLWNNQPQLLRAASAAAVLVIAIVIYGIIPSPAPRSVATLTVFNNSSTRSTDAGSLPSSITLKEDALKLILMLPQPASPGSNFSVELELLGANNGTQTFKAHAQDTQSISVQIPAAQLPRGQYVATVSTIDANRKAQRIPGHYSFKVE